jgi:hypothetical protein
MKKIIFGAIFSAFLLLAVQFVAPVNVKAAESSINEIKKNIGELTIQITDDKNFQTIIENEDLLNLLQQVLNGEVEFQTFADTVEATSAFQKLKTNTQDNINYLYSDMQTLSLPKNKDPDNSNYLKINLNSNNGVSIKGQNNDEITKGILVNENGNVKILGYGWLDEGDWLDFIGQLVVYLLGAALVVGVLIVALSIVMSVFTFIVGIIESAISSLVIFAIALAGVAVVLGLTDDIVEFFRDLADGTGGTAKPKIKLFRVLSNKIVEIINGIISRLNLQIKYC